MLDKESDCICSNCIHIKACQSWTSEILDNMDARPCRNYEIAEDATAYYKGHRDGMIEAHIREKVMEPEVDINSTDTSGKAVIRCPICGYALWNMERFCPYCGQRFVKED